MRKGRSECIATALGQYMKKRQYTENKLFKKSDMELNFDVKDMTIHKFIQKDTSCKDLLSFSSINADPNSVEQQFNRLKNFICDASEPMKSELTYILFPVYLYLQLELIASEQQDAAEKFYNKHRNLFTSNEFYQSLIENISCFHSSQVSINNNETFRTLKSSKYEVSFSADTLHYLLRFLKTYKQTLLLQILNVHINVRIRSNSESFNASQVVSKSPEIGQTSCVGDKDSNDDANSSLVRLENAIKKINESPPCLPSISHYSVNTSSHRISCLNASCDMAMLCGGSEDSNIRLWSLTTKPLIAETTKVDVSKLRLGCHEYKESDDVPEESSSVCGMKILHGHTGPVYDAHFVPNSATLLSCSLDKTVRAWNLNTFTNVAMYQGHNYPIWTMDVSTMGLYFVTGSHDRTARLWSLDRTFPIKIFTGHNMDVDSVKFHPNCNYVATGSSDRTVRLWSVQDGQMVRSFHGHRGSILALAFSNDGKWLASAGEDHKIKIWDLSSGNVVKELRGHTDTVYTLAFDHHSSIIASGGADGVIRLWDLTKSRSTHSHISTSADGHISSELLSEYPMKFTFLHLLRYTSKNVLYSFGTNDKPPD